MSTAKEIETKITGLKNKYAETDEELQATRAKHLASLEAAHTALKEFMNIQNGYYMAFMQAMKEKVSLLEAENASLKLSKRADNVLIAETPASTKIK